MATDTKPWTRDELARLPNDGNRYEVLDGELLVTPAPTPRHQVIAFELGFLVRKYVSDHQLGSAIVPGAVVFQSNELQPDVLVTPARGPFSLEDRWKDFPHPILVVEVLSSGSRRHDLIKKRPAYMRLAIPEYWVVDHEERRVLVLTSASDDARVETETLVWQPRTGIEPLTIDLRALLA